jgi:putative transposase
MARENSDWGCDGIAGALHNLGYRVSDQTAGNILRRFGIPPATKALPTDELGRLHPLPHGCVGIDFFTAEVLTWRGLTTYYVLFFLLCAVLPALGDAPCHPSWNYTTSD